MRVRLILGWVLVLSLVAAIGYAQTPAAAPTPTLSLAEALTIARRNNPAYLQTLNNRTPASRDLLSATTSLFTPSLTLSGGYNWYDGGRRFVQGTNLSYTGPTSTQLGGSIDISYQLSGATISQRGLARAELNATDEDITGAGTVLESSVRTQYLLLLEAQAQVAVAQRSVERATEQLNLAQARYTVGQGTLIDVRRAEVGKGTAEVDLLRAEQAAENQTLIMYGTMGVPAPTVPRVMLTDSFPVVAPAWSLDSLLTFAAAQNPSLRSLRARESSAQWNTRRVRSEYLPSLQMSAGTGRVGSHSAAYTLPQQDSLGNPLPPLVVPEITDWSTNPWRFQVGVSLPIYDGFSRYARTASARADEDDRRQQVRARELAVRSDVVAAYNGLQTAYRAVGLQLANKSAAAEALELATQRYRVGSGSYLELLDARVTADRADTDYITAVYAYHRAIATLEQAVGHTLR